MRNRYLIGIFLTLLFVSIICGAYLKINNEQLTTNKTTKANDETNNNSSSLADDAVNRSDRVTDSSTALVADAPRSTQNDSTDTGTIASPLQNTQYPIAGSQPVIQDTEYTVTITVNTTSYPLSVPPSTTVYDAMRLLQIDSRQPFMFSAKEYSGIGMFVEEINGVKNDTGAQKYWIMYVNGKSASVGASGYTLKDGDVIEWKFEKAKF